MALASVWATTLATQSYGPIVMIVCAVLVGTGAGLLNGILIAYGRMVPFIATLAMMVAGRGLAQRMSNQRTQLVQPDNSLIVDLSTTRLLGLPLLVYVFALVVLIGWVVLNRTTFGRLHLCGGRQPRGGAAGRYRRAQAHADVVRAVGSVLRDRRGADHGADHDGVVHAW